MAGACRRNHYRRTTSWSCWRAAGRTNVGQLDVIGRIAENEFVEQGGRGGVGEACDGAGAGTDEIGLNVGQRGVGPQSGVTTVDPGIVNVVERSAEFGSDVLITRTSSSRQLVGVGWEVL